MGLFFLLACCCSYISASFCCWFYKTWQPFRFMTLNIAAKNLHGRPPGGNGTRRYFLLLSSTVNRSSFLKLYFIHRHSNLHVFAICCQTAYIHLNTNVFTPACEPGCLKRFFNAQVLSYSYFNLTLIHFYTSSYTRNFTCT